jgi:hypothetical protein
MDLNIGVDIIYDGMLENENVFENTYLNVDRFVKNDGETIMNCQEVLISILSIFNAQICQQNGEWFVYRSFDLMSNRPIVKVGYSNLDYLAADYYIN